MAWALGSESRLKKQSYFGVGGSSTEKPMLIGLNAVKTTECTLDLVKKGNDQTLKKDQQFSGIL